MTAKLCVPRHRDFVEWTHAREYSRRSQHSRGFVVFVLKRCSCSPLSSGLHYCFREFSRLFSSFSLQKDERVNVSELLVSSAHFRSCLCLRASLKKLILKLLLAKAISS